MFKILSVCLEFYETNGLLGLSLRQISKLRAGGDNPLRFPHSDYVPSSKTTSSSSQSVEDIDNILNDDQISDALKQPYRKIRETLIFDGSEALKQERLIKSLTEKAKYPVYSKVKGKLPYIFLTPFTFAELNRLAAFRSLGFASAPLTLPAIIGFSLHCGFEFQF